MFSSRSDVARLEGRDHRPGVRPGDVVGDLDVGVEQLAEPVGHGLQAEAPRCATPFAPAEVSRDDDLGTLLAQVLQGGQRGPDATVVRDDLGVVRAVRTVGQGDVEVRPDQHGPPGDLQVVE